VRRIRRAFVASADLQPMARQLLQDRTPAAYAGVEAYARRHANADAGALAWLVLGYAHTLDHDYLKAIAPLQRARLHAGDLGEYVAYYLGTAYMQTGRSAEALATLRDFGVTYLDSLLIRDAHVIYASALLQQNRAGEAVALLEKDRQPPRADVEWNLGRAYEAAGETGKAITVFQNLYLTMPLAGEADAAAAELKKFPGTAPALTWDQRKIRADLLAKGRRYADASLEYREFINEVTPDLRPVVQLALAGALLKSGRSKDAQQALESVKGTTGEVSAQRIYLLGEVARATDDEDGFLKDLAQLRQEAPNSPWLEQALLSAGNIFLLKRDYDHAIDAYRELQQRFPNVGRAPYAHWKTAWLTLRQGRTDEAKKEFEEQIALYPSSNEVPAALYWRARLAQDEGDLVMARAFYQKISDRFRNYYYADLARKELVALKAIGEAQHYALLDKISPIDTKPELTEDDAPSDNIRVQKAQLLGNGGLVELAARELQAAAQEEKGAWAAPETARLYQQNQQFNLGIEVMKKAVPNYFAMDIPALPRAYWEALFPRPYWSDLKRYSARNELDPFLVASLIRQESEFNPAAVSHANAVGLMQLLPVTGKKVAKEEKLRGFNASQLFVPGVNLQLGTRYFRSMVDKFGSFEYALAAYNAGSDRVQDWLSAGKFRDPQEFVESIPFTETREYVQAILRNASVYKQLYGNP
jgi:soluble lytic murein transglycosylase